MKKRFICNHGGKELFLEPVQVKFREGNAFTGVCLFTGSGMGMSGPRSLLGRGGGGLAMPGTDI